MAFLVQAPIYGTIGLVKGVLCAVPCTVYTTLATSVISLYRLIPNAILAYKALWKTPLIGPTLKVVLAMVGPVPILLVPPIVAVGTCVGTALYSLFGPVFSTIVDGIAETSGRESICSMASVFDNCFRHVPKEYSKMMSQGYPEMVQVSILR